MDFKNTYLSDEELDKLITEIEQSDLVMAPPDIRKNVLEKAVNPKREFVTYCIRVIASVAAAICILFILPEVVQAQRNDIRIPTRDEVLSVQKIITKEEALEETDFVEKIIKNIGFFERNIVSATFMKENGGE